MSVVHHGQEKGAVLQCSRSSSHSVLARKLYVSPGVTAAEAGPAAGLKKV